MRQRFMLQHPRIPLRYRPLPSTRDWRAPLPLRLPESYRGSGGIRTIASNADSVTGIFDFRCRFASLVFGTDRHWCSVF